MYLIAIGEIFLKGKNRIVFERKLMKNIRSMLNIKPNELIKYRNRYILSTNEDIAKLIRIFGIVFYVKVKESKLENINEQALSLITNEKTFRVTAKKSIALKKDSISLNEEIGSYILSKNPELKVNLEKPEIDIRIEEISNKAYFYKASDMVKGLGGLPLGTGGFVQLRVEDEVNSAVAGFLLMKRGCIISLSKDVPLLHKFESGFNIRVREEKEEDIAATDETFESMEIKQDEKFILRPLMGYKKEEINKIYTLINSI